MNKNYLNELKDIQNLTKKIRQININENINFEDEQEFEKFAQDEQKPQMPDDEIEPSHDEVCANGQCDEPQAATDENPEDQGMKELDQMGEVDQIRRITLDGMRKLSDQPEHPQFKALLKIFQICNKAVETDGDDENKANV